MLITAHVADERVTTAHRAKLAYVYVRQSSLNQVRQHQESTQLQYRLVDRTIALGWPQERVQVIDEDLGKSGAGSVERYGFPAPRAAPNGPSSSAIRNRALQADFTMPAAMVPLGRAAMKPRVRTDPAPSPRP